MLNTRLKTALTTLTCLLAIAAGAQAQGISRGFGLSASGGYFTMGGSNYTNIDAGPGAEVTLRLTSSPELQLVVGGHYSRHKMKDGSDDMEYGEVYIEPRMVVNQEATLSPFVGLRVGAMRQWTKVEGTRTHVDGGAAAVTAGFLLQLHRMLAVELGGTAKAILARDVGGNSLGATLGFVFTPWGY